MSRLAILCALPDDLSVGRACFRTEGALEFNARVTDIEVRAVNETLQSCMYLTIPADEAAKLRDFLIAAIAAWSARIREFRAEQETKA